MVKELKTADFDYTLPDELIALHPCEKRDECRLLVVDKNTGQIEHKRFKDIISYLNPGDVLVLNNTRVLKARLEGVRKTGSKIEILLLETKDNIEWKCLTNRTKRLKPDEELIINDNVKGVISDFSENGFKTIKFNKIVDAGLLDEIGEIPLPPYIKSKRDADINDNDSYQTVYSKYTGSMASPTAGLHFTKPLLKLLSDKGIKIVYVTLHISLATFNPIRSENISEHIMHHEFFSVSAQCAQIISRAKINGNRVIAVGTTTLRALESSVKNGIVTDYEGITDLFIKPGYVFNSCDGLITNFHVPCSTLLVLVSAFSSPEIIKHAYSVAIENRYKFLSYGDAMLLQ